MSKEKDADVNTRNGTPVWPAEIVKKIKADFLEELNREQDSPFQGVGTMSELGPLVMSLVENYAESHPAVAHHEFEIANVQYARVGIKR